MRMRAINRAAHRLGRIDQSWMEFTEIMRAAAAESGYQGPPIGLIETVGAELKEIRQGLADAMVVKAVGRRLRGRSRRLITVEATLAEFEGRQLQK